MKHKNSFSALLFVTVYFFLIYSGPVARCQTVSADDEKKIAYINQWISQQAKKGKIPTSEQMDSLNKAVNAWQYRANTNTDSTTVKKENVSTLLPGVQKTQTKFIKKQCIGGGSFTVPANKIWKVKRVLVTDGPTGVNYILVTSVKYNKEYPAGAILIAPFISSESSLFNVDATGAYYIFEIEETDITR